jgi:hypothetical protein
VQADIFIQTCGKPKEPIPNRSPGGLTTRATLGEALKTNVRNAPHPPRFLLEDLK